MKIQILLLFINYKRKKIEQILYPYYSKLTLYEEYQRYYRKNQS
jgi:hypothetical protein